jgi:hypothetical protein
MTAPPAGGPQLVDDVAPARPENPDARQQVIDALERLSDALQATHAKLDAVLEDGQEHRRR